MDFEKVEPGMRVTIKQGVEGAEGYGGMPGTIDEIDSENICWIRLDNPQDFEDLRYRKGFYHHELIFEEDNE